MNLETDKYINLKQFQSQVILYGEIERRVKELNMKNRYISNIPMLCSNKYLYDLKILSYTDTLGTKNCFRTKVKY